MGLTVRTNESLDAAPLVSVTVMVTVTGPDWFGVGVSVTVRLESLPPKIMAETGSNAGFEEVAVSMSWPGGLSASPTVNDSCNDASSFTLLFGMSEMNGGSFTGNTVSWKLAELVAPVPSPATSVIVAKPNWLVSGVIVNVRV